jgi:hypothetical protein
MKGEEGEEGEKKEKIETRLSEWRERGCFDQDASSLSDKAQTGGLISLPSVCNPFSLSLIHN